MLVRAIEKFLFASRWLLAPFFIALALGLAVLLVKMGQAFYEFALHAWSGTESDAILGILGLIDLTLTGSLIVIVIFSGYENFVSRIDAAEHADWPEWMAKIDFTGLKLKLLSSIVWTMKHLKRKSHLHNAGGTAGAIPKRSFRPCSAGWGRRAT